MEIGKTKLYINTYRFQESILDVKDRGEATCLEVADGLVYPWIIRSCLLTNIALNFVWSNPNDSALMQRQALEDP